MNTCPKQWKTELAMDNPITESFENFRNKITAQEDSNTPDKLSQNAVPKNVPLNNDARRTLIRLIFSIDFQSYMNNAIKPIIFAKPSFTPGTATGNAGSIIWNRIAAPNRSASVTIFFVLVVFIAG